MIDINKLIIELNKGLTITELSILFNVSVSTIKRKMVDNNLKSLSRDIKKEDNKVETKCLECSKDYSYYKRKNKINKFCSKKCLLDNNLKVISNNREDVNDKISKALSKNIEIECGECNEIFIRKRKVQIFCSRRCSSKNVSKRDYIKEQKIKFFSELARKRYDSGDNSIGWQVRNILTPSFPEKMTINYLNNNLIEFEYEKKVGKYFIDFAFNKYKIALEIDGRTHDDVLVIEKDKRKDEFLKENGWRVFRIKWKNDNKHYDRLNEFIENVGLI